MSDIEVQAAKVKGPKSGEISVLSVTTASSSTDISVAAELGPGVDSVFVRIIAEVGIYYKWDAASGTADETATTGANRVQYLPAYTPLEEMPSGTFFTCKGTASGKVRISRASGR